MTEPKKFSRGHHSYTKWGPHFKVVQTGGKEKPAAPETISVEMDMDSSLETGIYANVSLTHFSGEEVILDFCFVPPGSKRGRVRSRVVLSHQHMDQLRNLLDRTKDDIQKKWSGKAA